MKNKYVSLVLLVIVGLVFMTSCLTKKDSNSEPVTFYADSLLEELTIDDKIIRAEIIILGEVKSNLPSKWKNDNNKETKYATSQEIFDAEGLFTDSLIRIDQIVKGTFEEPLIRVRSFVGETDHVQWKNSSQPVYDKSKIYLLFLQKDTGPTAKVDPGNYISVNSVNAVYEIIDGKAISADDEWFLEDLIAYIEKSLSGEALLSPFDLAIETPATAESIIGTGFELSNDIPDTHEAKEIIKTVERAYDIRAEAAYTFDLQKLPTVFINDPRFPLSEEQLETVRQLTYNSSLESAGELDYEIAFYSWWRDAVLHSETVHAKAKTENRALTEEERKSLIDPYGRIAPARVKSPTRKGQIRFLSVEIDENIATVDLDDGPRTIRMTLVFVDKKWYIANSVILLMHP